VLDEERTQMRDARIGSEKIGEEIVRLGPAQRSQPDFLEPAPVGEGRPVFGPICDDKQDAAASERVGEAAEHGLALGIEPVEVLDQDGDRALLRFQIEDGADCALDVAGAGGGIESGPAVVGARRVEERSKRRTDLRRSP
jgi:hypothetical protein